MPRSLVFGLPHEDEVRCARGVASAVGSLLSIVPPREDKHTACFLRQAKLETLPSTLWSMSFSASLEAFHPLPKWLISGTFGDHMPGGCAPNDGYDPMRGRFTASQQISRAGAWGLAPRDIVRLFPGTRIETVVRECIDALHAEWHRHPVEEFQRAWLWTTRHQMRHHLAPGAWRQSGLYITYQPFAARLMVEFCAALPLSAMHDRRLETDYLRRRLPELASLPLVRNSGNLAPLAPTIGYQVGNVLRRAVASRLPKGFAREVDRRTYHRTHDFDGPGCRSVREFLEPLRRESRLFDRQVLDELLPASSKTTTRVDSIVDGAKSKNLLALLYVLAEYGTSPLDAVD